MKMTSLKPPGSFQNFVWSVRKDIHEGYHTAIPNIELVPAKNPTVASDRLDAEVSKTIHFTSEARKSG